MLMLKQTQLVITAVKDLHTSREPEADLVILVPQDLEVPPV